MVLNDVPCMRCKSNSTIVLEENVVIDAMHPDGVTGWEPGINDPECRE